MNNLELGEILICPHCGADIADYQSTLNNSRKVKGSTLYLCGKCTASSEGEVISDRKLNIDALIDCSDKLKVQLLKKLTDRNISKIIINDKAFYLWPLN